MRLKVSTALAVGLLLAGCQSQPEEKMMTSMDQQMAVPGSPEDFAQNAANSAYFALNSARLDHAAQHALVQQAKWLKKYPHMAIYVQGHCDERGTREYNLALGERRAEAAKRFLIAQGIDRSRIKTVSYGKDRPLAEGSNERAWAMNRVSVSVAE